MTLADALRIFEGSNGDDTKALYAQLEALGPAGVVALNVFRALKCSTRAKVYRGGIPGQGSFRSRAYDRKQWSMDNLCEILTAHGEALSIRWGWRQDLSQEWHAWVLYLDLPTGQISFHTATRGRGPDYPGDWDRVRDAGAGRVCRWIATLFVERSVEA